MRPLILVKLRRLSHRLTQLLPLLHRCLLGHNNPQVLVTVHMGMILESGEQNMSKINILLTTFSGLNLPKTVCLSLLSESSIANLLDVVGKLLPANAAEDAILLLRNGRILSPSAKALASIVEPTSRKQASTDFVQITLSVRLRGGKGGFGSQLRAAGGRMSSRKRKQNAELATGSARNLDGRRLRTITEAKNLATYLATKPDMDRKEKEERRKRWEAVVELAEQREADMKAGKTADGHRKGLSSEWLEEKDEVGENIKSALKAAMAANQQGQGDGSRSGASAQASADEDSDVEDPMELDEQDMHRLRVEAESGDADALWVLENKLNIPKDLLPKPKSRAPRFAGFDDDLSGSEPDENGAKATTPESTS